MNIKQQSNGKKALMLGVIYVGYMLLFADRTLFNLTLASMGKDLGLNAVALGAASSAFFFGYTLMQIPGGYLTDYLGQRRVIIVSLLGWSALTLATGWVWSLLSVIVLRCLFGIFQGPYPAAALKQVKQSTKKQNHAQITALMLSSNYAGAALAPVVLVPILVACGWRMTYYVAAIMGLIIVLLFLWLVPKTNPTTSKPKFSWRILDRRLAVFVALGLVLNVITKALETWMPVYFLTARHINLANLAWLVPLPTIAGGIAAAISGWVLVAWFTHKERWLLIIACLACVAALVGLVVAKNLAMIVGCQMILYFFKSLAFTGLFGLCSQTHQKKNYGAVVGMVNFGGQLGGFLGPLLLGLVVQLTGGYPAAFSGLLLCGVIAAGLSVLVRPLAEK